MRKTINITIIAIIILATNIEIYSQEHQKHQSVLSAPENWQSEILTFPLGFAQDIDLVGFEDLRFAPGWSDSTSQEFWTYTFVWYVEKDSAMTENILTKYFNIYYDGLMGVDNNNKIDTTNANQLDKTICRFVKTDEGFTGEMRVYDRFFTKDYMTLNIKVKESFCSKTNKQIVFCDISPKEFSHAVWKIFDNVKLIVSCD